MALEVAARGLEVAKVDSVGTKCSCISRLVASSMNTSSVHAGARSSNQAMVAAVDLDQLAQARAAVARLVDLRCSLLARHPQAGGRHQRAHGLLASTRP